VARLQDSPNLFGVGMGYSTTAEVICEFCGKVYNRGIGVDDDDDSDEDEGESVLHTEFAGLQVCECCFEKIENEILHRIHDILPWYRRYVQRKKHSIELDEKLLKDIGEG